jgi:hypothetical protein
VRVSWICINIVIAGYQLIVINKAWKSIKGIKRNLRSHKLIARNIIAGVVGRTIVLELNTSILIGINQARTPINVKKSALRCNRSLCSIVIMVISSGLYAWHFSLFYGFDDDCCSDIFAGNSGVGNPKKNTVPRIFLKGGFSKKGAEI